jgi:YbbR domain-containing protein
MKMKSRMKKHSLKLIAVFLSIFLWFYVLNSEKVKFEKTVPLEYILPTDMMFAQKPPHEVVFMIEGPRAFVRTVSEREDRLILDLNRANLKQRLNFNVDINPSQLNLPFGMKVERVLPRKLNIRMEKKASKIVPIKPQFTGQLPGKLFLSSSSLQPAEVEVYGPRSLISRLKELPIKPIELDGLPGSEVLPVELQLPDERLTVTSGFDIRFFYQLKASSSNLSLENLPIRFLPGVSKIQASVKKAAVRLFVPETILKNRSNISNSVQIWADIPQKVKGKVTVPLRVVLPPTMHLLEVVPKTIIVNVE